MNPYTCDRCAACCTKLIVEVEPIDVAREPKVAAAARPFRTPPGWELEFEDEGERAEHARVGSLAPGWEAGGLLAPSASGPACPLLGADNLCTIYPTRPACCVAMQAGSDQCQLARRSAGLPPLEPAAAAAGGAPSA